MAGDWIKMRIDLGDDPAVVQLSDALGISEDETIGKLHRLWSWADRHTCDGTAPGITERWVDKFVGKRGFAKAMCSVGWLGFTDSGVEFPNFDRHNGASAKKRCDATIRQRLSRGQRDAGETGENRDTIPRPFRKFVLERDGYECVYCGTTSSKQTESSRQILSVDHVVPKTRGGQTAVDNLACCCKLCNAEKNDRTPEEWGILPTFLQDGVTYVSHKMCDSRGTKVLPEKRREEKRREENTRGELNLSPSFDTDGLKSAVADWSKYVPQVRPGQLFDQIQLTNLLMDKQRLGWDADKLERAIRFSIGKGFKSICDPDEKMGGNGQSPLASIPKVSELRRDRK